tara:strand:+ start:633 stop:1661 length:1029 start_codon:yes stop_codon:yes gene_type:complete
MRIVNIGGSNSVRKQSYTHKLIKDKYNLSNYAIGGVNSVCGLIQLIKNKAIGNCDTIIYDYFTNDNNHFRKGINKVSRVNKTLIELVNLCIENNIKLLFVYIYNRDDKINGLYDKSPMYSFYKDFSKKYNITTIDVYDLLYSKYKDEWSEYYTDKTHLSDEGMNTLRDEIIDKLKVVTVPKTIEGNDYNGFNGLNLIKIDNHLKTENFSNSFVDVNYFEIKNELKIRFNKKTSLLAIEYISDIDSGIIGMSNNVSKTQKNALIYEEFILKKKKQIVTIMTSNKKPLKEDDCLFIKNIPFKKINYNIFDKDRNTFIREKRIKPTYFKIISILVTDNADIKSIE